MRRDPVVFAVLALGFAAGYCRGWLTKLVPTYPEWGWKGQTALRAAIIAASVLVVWMIITWRTSWSGRHAEPGAYWAMWAIGLVIGVVADEIHGYVDGMFS